MRYRCCAALVTVAVLFAQACNAQIYRYIDHNGMMHLTNIPRAPAKTVATPPPYRELVEHAARRYDVNPRLIHAVIFTESGYRPNAVSRKGAVGLMQLMPGTAQRYGVSDVRDPAQNIRGGAQYLRDLLEMFDHDLPLSLAAYNAGEAAVIRYGGIPPYPETSRYVRKVLQQYSSTYTQ